MSGNFIIAQPLGVDDGVDYCHSGRIRRIDEEAIHRQLDNGAIVLMGPVAVSVTGESFNLTSEEIATQLAIKLKAGKNDRLLLFARGVQPGGRDRSRSCSRTKPGAG
ncbi:Amino-acid acetyltransferase [Raoultella terrigena]|uniref:Amino-acid acetyltransferase n=1 Tax=Raoultella terrigena TaxID=577 RepID=A0A4U9CZE2_RAOTE|nr:Amino-acid acetyltransferase [Raoultella terrigena]